MTEAARRVCDGFGEIGFSGTVPKNNFPDAVGLLQNEFPDKIDRAVVGREKGVLREPGVHFFYQIGLLET